MANHTPANAGSLTPQRFIAYGALYGAPTEVCYRVCGLGTDGQNALSLCRPHLML